MVNIDTVATYTMIGLVGFLGYLMRRLVVLAFAGNARLQRVVDVLEGDDKSFGLRTRVNLMEADTKLIRETLIEAGILERRRAKIDPS